jgi:hypothetical protein
VHRFLDDYMVQISNMVRFNKSTVYVNFHHLQEVGGVDRERVYEVFADDVDSATVTDDRRTASWRTRCCKSTTGSSRTCGMRCTTSWRSTTSTMCMTWTEDKGKGYFHRHDLHLQHTW